MSGMRSEILITVRSGDMAPGRHRNLIAACRPPDAVATLHGSNTWMMSSLSTQPPHASHRLKMLSLDRGSA